MDIAGVAHPLLDINDFDVIDGDTLIMESRSAAPVRAEALAGVDMPPLTLYGAYRQGVADYFARRPNPYRLGSRLADVWQEGRLEAATRSTRRAH
ncbi:MULTISPECIES: hypothetical protein [Burkholderia]|uniref:hypothetical protein n=1 Tax=Burkholderia TaxID=32008 RepID=UPI00068C57B3|nr:MULTISPECIES: hypothetical protein [Burkholderia]AYQ90289.1 hypothetical protein EDD84_23070 [Burkholderia gladioli]KVM71677.1 hypothetical protein WJ59_06565 [Burkholderia gladioli]NBI49082.1 hypothetical protein [Burkholderia sp. ISTR5]